jgi:asparagine synthase (glutamine-hydrolysing)
VCGICGKLSFDRDAALAPALLKTMADTIEHRGPDDEGYYISGPVGFGFRRLSMVKSTTTGSSGERSNRKAMRFALRPIPR